MFDVLLLVAAVGAPILALYMDGKGISHGFFIRSGAITTLFAVFLEFRTHAVQEHESLLVVWRSIGDLAEELVKIEKEIKAALMQIFIRVELNQLSSKNRSVKEVEDTANDEVNHIVKNLPVLMERLRPLQTLPAIEDFLLKYNRWLSLFSKLLVLLGTLIWAFGDIPISKYYS